MAESRVLPFHEGNESDHTWNYHTTALQNGGQETELGLINTGYNGHAVIDDDVDICENRDNEINDRRISLKIDETNDNDGDKDETKDEYKSLVPFCFVVGFGTLFSQSITVYLSSQITVLERTFGLSSSKSGFLLSANDIGFVVTVLLASHFLKNHNIPRVLAICIFVFGVSGIVTSLPHFITDEKEMTVQSSKANSSSTNTYLCVPGLQGNSSETQTCAQRTGTETSGGNTWVVALIATTMAIQGVAKAPRVPLSSLYVDNNSSKEKTGFYIGILMSFSIFGPFIALTAGGLFNKLPVDLKDTSLTPDDPRWIGAWWLGFIVFGACAVLTSFPIFFFPASLRKKEERTRVQQAEYANSSVIESSPTFTETLKDLPKSVLRVLQQPVYVCNLLSVLCLVFAFMAYASFGPKYIENQFRIPTWKANVILGLEKLVTTVIGTFLGGVITRRLRLGLYGCVKMLLLCRSVSCLCQSVNFILGCDNPLIIGLTAENSRAETSSCDCTMTPYLPMCLGEQTFYSPCHAGCSSEIQGVYSNCTAANSDGSMTGTVTPGLCGGECSYLLPFIVLNAFSSLIGTMTISPSYVTMLRSVPDKDRAMAVGLQSFLMALLVFLPAPIVYGGVFDSLCLLWKSTCSGKGACLLYDVTEMRYKLVGINVGLIVIGLLLTCVTCLFARRKVADESRRLRKSIEVKPPVPQPRPSLSK
ncbi:solute carrier organic anion transporter family member 2B1-like [Mercenaria mercenaria]|uniref:solute carrier organic anion transporter family member 2B1-like n=1 Tax=Mercenaria mercenaria TaxID=6596 RepID=UPI00234EE8C7|nr:solute carrier organic anion transporter family member 2B1-like [Mercenaria mercenaria]